MYFIIACEVSVSNGYAYSRAPFGFSTTAATHATSTAASVRTRPHTGSLTSPSESHASNKSPAIVIAISASPTANPACLFTQRTVSGTSHHTLRLLSPRAYPASTAKKTLANRNENICGRTPQVGDAASAPRSSAKPATYGWPARPVNLRSATHIAD